MKIKDIPRVGKTHLKLALNFLHFPLRCFYHSQSLFGALSSLFVLLVRKVAFPLKFPTAELFFGAIPATDFTWQLCSSGRHSGHASSEFKLVMVPEAPGAQSVSYSKPSRGQRTLIIHLKMSIALIISLGPDKHYVKPSWNRTAVFCARQAHTKP